MKLQKILLFCLSFCMVTFSFAAHTAIFAESEETVAITSESGVGIDIEVTTVVEQKPSFTATVPSGISFGNISKSETDSVKSADLSVGISDFSEMVGKQIKVTVSTPDGAFHLHSGQNKLSYRVYNSKTSETPLEMNGVFYTFTEPKTVTGCIKINEKDITAAGDYGGILTFTFSVEEQAVEP